jgi:hypothetical protein
MNPPSIDSERLTFLRALDAAQDIEVNNFEALFIESALRYQTTSPAFSEKQRAIIDRIWCRYGPRLPESAIRNPQSAILPTATAGTCGYIIRDDSGRPQHCGAPAAVKLPRGLELCAEHDRQRLEHVARQRQIKSRSLHN